MSYEKPRVRPKRTCIEIEEARAWVGFYRRVSCDPAVATEVMAQLEAVPEMKRAHLALYLCCKESLRTHKATQARNKRIGQFVRWLAHGLVIAPAQAMHRAFHQGRDIAVECLPTIDSKAGKEPGVPQVRRLRQEAEFAQAQASFDAQAGAPSSEPTSTPDVDKASPQPKAAPAAA
jgi:hypothetical protein